MYRVLKTSLAVVPLFFLGSLLMEASVHGHEAARKGRFRIECAARVVYGLWEVKPC